MMNSIDSNRRSSLKKTLLAAATAAALTLLAAPVAFAQDATRYGTWGIDTAGMDPEVDPGADFFRYVSGNWADTTEIPSDRSSYGSFLVLRDLSEGRVRKVGGSTEQGVTADGGAA